MADVPRETILENKYSTAIIGAGISGCIAASLLSEYDIKTIIFNISMDSPAYIKYSNKIGGKRYNILKKINKIEKTFFNNIEKTSFLKKHEKKDDTYSYIFDRRRFSLNYKYILETKKNLNTRQGLVQEIVINENGFTIILNDGEKYYSKYLIVSCGTFLNGNIYIGKNKIKAGRQGEISSINLAKNLKEIGIFFNSCKSYVAAYIDGKTINKKDEIIDNDYCLTRKGRVDKRVLNTYLLYDQYVINENKLNDIEYSFNSNINSNIKKILYVIYPDSLENEEYYISPFFSLSSEPQQEKLLNKIYCLEKAIITRPSYYIEYDYIDKNQLNSFYESKIIKNLYFIGEINGTKEYESVAYEGVAAASNIINKFFDKKLLNLKTL